MNMFSSFQNEQTYSMQVFNALMFCLIVLLYWKSCISKFNAPLSKYASISLLLLFLIYSITPTYTGDFWGYKPLVENFDPKLGTWHLEEVYQGLLRLIGPNYLLFRVVVWGTAEFLFILTCLRFRLNPYKALLLLFCLFVTKFVYARVSLAMAVYFLGVSFFCYPIKNKKAISIIIGIFIIVLSLFFHRSMIVVLLLTPIICIPLSKNGVALIILILPLLTFLLRNLLIEYSYLFVEEERVSDMVTYSSTKDFGEYAMKTNLLFWWNCLPFFTTFFVISKYVISNKIKSVLNKSSVLLYRLVFGITIFSYCCYFIRPENPTLFYRYLYMTMIPLVIILAELRKNKIIKQKTFVILAIIGLTPELATFFYRVFIKFTPIGIR